MKQILKAFLLLGAIALLARDGLSVAHAASTRPAADPEVGRQAYQDSCIRCHGVTGAGDGRDAAKIFPKPRALSEGVFKFRTTASGTPPTDEDLYRTISEGLPGSRMPEFQRLPEETRWQLVEYIKTLSPVFKEQKPELIPLGKDPGPQKANWARGKELYTQLGCNACHGAQGRADGPSAPTLVDSAGQLIRPADLTQGWRYRGGAAPREIVTRLMTGLDGTPMPSYAEATPLADAWDLAYYVHSLQETPNWSRTVEAARVEGALPTDPQDPAWQKTARADLRLTSSYYQAGAVLPTSVSAVGVQALTNGTDLAFRLTWHDPQENRSALPDAAAVALLANPREKWTLGSVRILETPSPLVTMWTAESSNSASFFANGEWTVVIHRPLPSAENKFRFGIMVFDGGNGESGRHRANSSWMDLIFKG